MATTVQTANIAYPTMVTPQVVATVPGNNTNGMNVKSIRGLGITQIVIGALTVLLGIIAVAVFEYKLYWVNNSGSGIWFGIWITITGIIGVMSAKNPHQTSLNGVNMGFNIVSTVVSFFVGIFFIVALVYYSNCDSWRRYSGGWNSYSYYDPCYSDKSAGTAIYAILMILMVAEFFISMAISIICCQHGCCRSSAPGGVIIQQQAVPTVVSTGVVVSSQGHQQVAYPPQSAAGYPPQSQIIYPAGAYPNQQYVTTSAPMGGYPQPAYSNQMPPQDPSKVAPPPAYTS